MRVVVLATVVEFRGSLVDVTAGDDVFDYDLQDITDALFGNFPHKAEMTRELRAFLLTTSNKTSDRRTGEFFRRYVNALPHPRSNGFVCGIVMGWRGFLSWQR